MKRILILVLLLAMLLTACDKENKTVTEEPKKTNEQQEITKKEISQEEINDTLRQEAILADFIKINGNEWEDKKVYAEGKVSNLTLKEPMITFTLSQVEGDGYGMYEIATFRTLDSVYNAIEDGNTVKIYGTVSGKNDYGMPLINSTIVENTIE